MPRGVRRSPLEKLQDELKETQEAVRQYKNCLNTLRKGSGFIKEN